MFPEFRDRISQLKTENAHFAKLFHRHNELDQEIKNLEADKIPSASIQIENLKKEKLRLKDSLYAILREAPAA
ncbi:YdcH family protein [Andreprevotia chitinilytica]|uniref:YdcH family protein n=1 Tax=Andreprevotia chitinilytica TaxID=396808 RepID=UPI000556C0FA|nr:YdcH family protein [Andreprevotia chitinilytica]